MEDDSRPQRRSGGSRSGDSRGRGSGDSRGRGGPRSGAGRFSRNTGRGKFGRAGDDADSSRRPRKFQRRDDSDGSGERPRRRGQWRRDDSEGDRQRRPRKFQRRDDSDGSGDRPRRQGQFRRRDESDGDRPRRPARAGGSRRSRDDSPNDRRYQSRGPRGAGQGRDRNWDRQSDDRREQPAYYHDDPALPEDLDEAILPMAVRAELKGLSSETASRVGRHIIMAGSLVDTDPELAYAHAEAAVRRAKRVPIVREAMAETAYAAGKYEVSLREYRALRRMTGNSALVPVIADCERALGKHREALATLRSEQNYSPETAIEVHIVEAGIRDDLGQRDEALRLLKSTMARARGPKPALARLSYAYADLLERAGDPDAARQAFETASGLDVGGDLDCTDRIAQLDGVELPESLELEAEEEQSDQAESAEEEPTAAESEEVAPE